MKDILIADEVHLKEVHIKLAEGRNHGAVFHFCAGHIMKPLFYMPVTGDIQWL